MKSPILLAVASTLIFSITAKASILDDFSSNSSADYNTIDAFATAGSFGISNNEFAPEEPSYNEGTTYYLRNTGEYLSPSGGQSVSIQIVTTGEPQASNGFADAAGLGFSTSLTSDQNGTELLLTEDASGGAHLGSLGSILINTSNGFSLTNAPATLTVTREATNPTLFDYVLTGGGLNQTAAAQGTLSYPSSAGLPVYFGMAASYGIPDNSVREGNLTFSGTTNLPPTNNLPVNGLISLWSAESNGLDSFGTNNATVSSGMTYAPGEIGQAFNFDGTSNSMVTIPVSDSLNVGAGSGFTLSCWINPTNTNAQEPLMEWDGPISWETQLWINTAAYGVGGPGGIFANLMDNTGFIHPMSSSPGIIQAGVFQHVALTYDKTSGLGKLYYNGTLVASQNLGSFTPKTDTLLLLGARITGGIYHYQGLMDEVSVYNRALSAPEIQELATNQPVLTNAPAGTNPQTISPFSFIPNQTFGGSPFSITPPTSSSSLTVLLSVLSGPATISGDTVMITGAGTVVLAADQAGNTNYAAAPEVTTSFRVAQATQTISPFIPIAQQALTEQSFDITPPAASSSLPVTVIVKGGPATISGNTVTLQGTGLVYLAADQSGDSNYTAAPEVITSFLVKASYQDFTTPFTSPPDKTYGDAPFRIVPPKIDSHLPVKLSVLFGPAKISGDLVTITGTGIVYLTADQPGNAKYAAATELTTSFIVFPASQTIKLPRIPTKKPGEVVELPKNASSGLPITYSIVMASPDDINLITLSENKVSLTSRKQLKGDIQVVIAANQSGNLNYRPAVGQTVTITFKR